MMFRTMVRKSLRTLHLLNLYYAGRTYYNYRRGLLFQSTPPTNLEIEKLQKLINYDLEELIALNRLMPNQYPYNKKTRHSLDRSLQRYDRFTSILKSFGVNLRGTSTVDIGCGKGALSIYLALNGATNVMGLDLHCPNSLDFKGIPQKIMRRISCLYIAG